MPGFGVYPLMVKRMLIDATHPEETRVVVMNGTRLEEFDVETSTKRQIKGNVYLAKVVRVEPSLQAAFVDYGGNRHGFLAFGEIHPDYYQIPVADRERLLAEEAQSGEDAHDAEAAAHADGAEGAEAAVEHLGGDDADDAGASRRNRSYRQYKIQEVIKRRQILLVQVVKEERGNKGAALTTYLSLAGRYCVLMPNTPRGGGVSRKITSVSDRRRLKDMMSGFEVPEGMAVIVRTAGSERSKAEIKRDYEYLLRTWNGIRTLTLQSRAPALVYEEATLIKRAIRDVYSRDIEEILVEGDEGYRIAKDFMKALTPSHAKKVQPYKDSNLMPLYHRYQVESQLEALHNIQVTLKSGGYIVINPTEALVAIDVNSGRSTRERNIEETALKTNIEASDEIARQLRLRDLAGLVVIDYIDMEDAKNNAAVERRLKEALRSDRARIQLGRISPFGLMELSRQRLRPSFVENSYVICPHCKGTGMIRSIESEVVRILRVIEEEGVRRRSAEVEVTVPINVALYILNQKRAALAAIEARYSFSVSVEGEADMMLGEVTLERTKAAARGEAEGARDAGPHPVTLETAHEEGEIEEEGTPEEEEADSAPDAETPDGAQREGSRKKRRRRKRRGRRSEGGEETPAGTEALPAMPINENGTVTVADEDEGEAETGDDLSAVLESAAEPARRPRRRGRRGGRRRNRQSQTDVTVEEVIDILSSADETPEETIRIMPPAEAEPAPAAEAEVAFPSPSEAPAADEAPAAESAPAIEPAAPEAKPKPRRSRRKAAAKAPTVEGGEVAAPEGEAATPARKPAKAKRAKTETAKTGKSKAAKPRAPRARAAAPADVASTVIPIAVPAAELAPVAEPVPAAESVPAPAAEAAPAEPASMPEPASDPQLPAQPARRGWWNR